MFHPPGHAQWVNPPRNINYGQISNSARLNLNPAQDRCHNQHQGYYNPASFHNTGDRNIHGNMHITGNWVSTMDMRNMPDARIGNIQGGHVPDQLDGPSEKNANY
jgi:hypothetical protein